MQMAHSSGQVTVKDILQSIGLGALSASFERQKIDSLDTCRALSDEELKSLGLSTIGDRADFRRTLEEERKSRQQPEGGSQTQRVSQLFRPSRNSNGPRIRRKQSNVRTWTGNFFCLSDRKASRPPLSSEKLALQAAGLGLKKIQFKVNDNEEVVYNTLTGEAGFEQLKEAGGFELLHCMSNCRELQVLTCKWDIESLHKIIGSQAKVYIRPIQKNLKLSTPTNTAPSSLKGECNKCHKECLLSDLREHISNCESQNELAITDYHHESTIEDTLDIHPQPQSLFNTIENRFSGLPPNITTSIETVSVALPEIENQQSYLLAAEVMPQMTIQNSESEIKEIVNQCVQECKQNNIGDPVDILKMYQSKIVTGRKLDIEDQSETLEGDTNFIMIDRDNLVQSAIGEIDAITDLRLCLEVQFYGETAVDIGGPRKEFFALALRKIKDEYFDPVREWSSDYIVLGKIMALSVLQNGKLPRILSADLIEETFKSGNPRPFVKDLRTGLDSLGIYQLTLQLPVLIHLFTPGAHVPLTFKMLNSLLQPEFSAEGSNRKKKESAMYSLFLKYMREAASGRRGGVNLCSILRFATGSEEEPALGFSTHPSIGFIEMSSFLPTSNTCINRLNITIPTEENRVPEAKLLYNLFDYAFSNTYFGLK